MAVSHSKIASEPKSGSGRPAQIEALNKAESYGSKLDKDRPKASNPRGSEMDPALNPNIASKASCRLDV